MTELMLRSTSIRSHLSSCRSSIRQPVFSALCHSSIVQRARCSRLHNAVPPPRRTGPEGDLGRALPAGRKTVILGFGVGRLVEGRAERSSFRPSTFQATPS
jgi:hypothetical protein